MLANFERALQLTCSRHLVRIVNVHDKDLTGDLGEGHHAGKLANSGTHRRHFLSGAPGNSELVGARMSAATAWRTSSPMVMASIHGERSGLLVKFVVEGNLDGLHDDHDPHKRNRELDD